MSETNWSNIDLNFFSDCTTQMKYDEFIYNNLFQSSRAMKSITLGSQRSDSHLIADGMHSINDYIEKGNYLPDENITPDEIRKIQGKLLDCMVARFDGNNLFQTVLTCVYVHRNYTIKNPLLQAVIFSYIYLILTVEKFVNKYKAGSPSAWANDGGIGISFLPEKSNFDPSAIRSDLEKFSKDDPSISDIISFSTYMLNFAEYLNDLQSKTPPEMPQIPKESEMIGFSDVLHNRQLSTQTPPLIVQIQSHEKSVQQFTEMVNLILGFKDIPKPTSILEILDFLFEWSVEHQKTLILPRIILKAVLFPNLTTDKPSIYGWADSKEFLISEFKKININEKIFSLDKAVTIESTVYNFLIYISHSFLMPICIAHSSLEKHLFQYWSLLQNYLVSSLNKTAKFMSFPKIDSESMSRIVENPMIYWTRHISIELARIYLKLGIKCGIYNVLDYIELFLFFSILHKALRGVYYDERTVSKVYEVFNFQGHSKNKKKIVSSSNVTKRMGEESDKEIEQQIISTYYEYCIHLMQFALKTNSIKLLSNEFYNPKKVYESRKNALPIIESVQFLEYSNFEILYDYKKLQLPQIQNEIKRKANDTKELIKKLNSRPNPSSWIKDILKKVVMSSLFVSQWKEGNLFSISFDNDCIPEFQLIKQ